MSLEIARQHLDLASVQLDRAQTASWEPAEPESCVSNAFYAYENLIVAVAEAKDVAWARNHYRKADLAKEFAEQMVLSVDLSGTLLHLNDLRKDVSYGEPGFDLSNGCCCRMELLLRRHLSVIVDAGRTEPKTNGRLQRLG
jgi:hypothetical protein